MLNFIVSASVGPAVFIVAASYAGCDRLLVVILFTIAMGTMGGFYPGEFQSWAFESVSYLQELFRNESQRTGSIAKLCGFIDGNYKRHWRFDRHSRVRRETEKRSDQNLTVTLIFSPFLVGILTPNRSLSEWRIVFWIAFGVFNITNIVYIIWASGEIQPWNDGYLIKNSVENASTSEDDFNPQQPQRKIEDLKSDNLKWR